MTFGSLFAGIGGIDLGLERAGLRVLWQCEIDPWCSRVLARHWPHVTRYGDVATLGRTVHPEPVDLLAGGFPCQPVSLAGHRGGTADVRWLWPEFVRVIRLLRPRIVFVENVPGLLVRGMGDVLGGLAACGYDAEWDCLGAADLGAPHRRVRVWIVARRRADAGRAATDPGGGRGPDGELRPGRDEPRLRGEDVADPERVQREAVTPAGRPAAVGRHAGGTDSPRGMADPDRSGRNRRAGIFGPGRWPEPADGGGWPPEPAVGRMAYGVPGRVDRLRGLGNAVVPACAEAIGRRIIEEGW